MCKGLINNRFIKAIDTILERENMLTKGVLSQNLGISQQKFTEILKGRMNVGADLLASLITSYPDISADWLLTGSGSMTRSNVASVPSDETPDELPNSTVSVLLKHIDDLNRENERLTIELNKYRPSSAIGDQP